MEVMTLKAQIRDKKGSKECDRLRKQKMLPAVLYGGEGKNELLVVPYKEAYKLLGYSTRLIDLILGDKTEKVMVKDLKYSSIDESIVHIDFVRVTLDEMITVSVEVLLKGIPKGVKEGGVLDHNLKQIAIKGLPATIPEKIEVDVGNLELNGLIRVKDITLPSGITTTVGQDVVIVGVHPPRVEEVAPVPGGAIIEPEVITQKKPLEETEGKEETKDKPSHKEKGG
jgi:large subunit ribosomal protein L25